MEEQTSTNSQQTCQQLPAPVAENVLCPVAVSKDDLVVTSEDSTEDKANEQRRYEAELDRLKVFREELIVLFYKSQDFFEKQLSFISAGALTLSIGFIKDLVSPFKESNDKFLLGWGWGALILTLLLNCLSHLLGAQHANKAIGEININKYDAGKVKNRNKLIVRMNWSSVLLMIIGIALIVSFITKNTLMTNEKKGNTREIKTGMHSVESTKGLTSSAPPSNPQVPVSPVKPK